MNLSTRRRLLDKHQATVEMWWVEEDAGPSDPLQFEVASRRNYVDSLRAFDPSATFAEELTVRLSGEFARTGLLDLELSPILHGLQRVFSDARSIGLALADIGSGSTVLHLRPVPAASEDRADVLGDSQVAVDATPADDVGRTLIRVVDAAEQQADLRPWANSYVRGLEEVSSSLDEHDLTADFTWSSMRGNLTAARLTSRGRGYLRSLRTGSVEDSPTWVSGRVTELREAGFVKLKTGTSRTSPTHDVHIDSEELLRLGLSLGETAHFVVRELTERDRLGRELRSRLEYVRLASAEEPLDLDEP